jgi:membrane fusion protein (multidrug efflux system)
VRRFTNMTVVLGAVTLAGCFGKEKAPVAAPPEVLVATVEQQDVPVGLEAVGQTRGSEEVEIRARVEGYLQSINFTEGQPVKRGDLLYVIDPRPFEAAVSQARGQLAEAQAALAKARNDVARYRPLVAQRAVSQQELDNALAAEQRGLGSVEAAEGALREAQVNLSFTRVTAPTAGVAGISAISVGNLVGPNLQQPLTTVSQIDPIRVRVSLPERQYLELAREAADRRAAGDTTAKRPIQLVLVDGSVHPQEGRLRAVEARTDPTTGSMIFEVEFPNPERIVRAGQFARIRTVRQVLQGALVVPARAVTEQQGVQRVAVVAAGDSVQMRSVTVGPKSGDLLVITDGLAAGERVIVEGAQRVRSGMVVRPRPAPAGADTTSTTN